MPIGGIYRLDLQVLKPAKGSECQILYWSLGFLSISLAHVCLVLPFIACKRQLPHFLHYHPFNFVIV